MILHVEKQESSFSRKRSKKLLRTLSRTAETTRFTMVHLQETKVFWFFFSKKNRLLSTLHNSFAQLPPYLVSLQLA